MLLFEGERKTYKVAEKKEFKCCVVLLLVVVVVFPL